MNWDAIGAIGEIVGAGAVVVTLIYLSLQIRETSRQMRVTSLTDSNALVADAFLPVYNNENNLRIWISGVNAPETLSDEEREVFMLFMTRIMAAFETMADHHQFGAIPDDRFANYSNIARNFLSSPGGKAWSSEFDYQFSSAAKSISITNQS